MFRTASRRRSVVLAGAFLALAALAVVSLVPSLGRSAATQGPSVLPPTLWATSSATDPATDPAASVDPGVRPASGSPTAAPTAPPTATPTAAQRQFQLIDMFAPEPPQTPKPTKPGSKPGRPEPPLVDPGRPVPDQSFDWLVAKASGRIVLSDGKIGLLPAGTYPLVNVASGAALPAARTLEVNWTRWIIEPTATGKDARGNSYHDITYWNLCGPGAATVTLYYWQQLTGRPDVTTREGYFLEPYTKSGVAWPSPGPTFRAPDGTYHRLGTYWTGKDRVPGFTARSRGFLMYMAMGVLPDGWTVPGIDVFAGGDGKALYPTRGSPMPDTQAALNWEASGHSKDWTNTWYATVPEWDPTMARDLQAAVMLDVGRDGVPVIVSADTFYLPNWQAGSRTPHTRHSVTIVGYDNSANPPTYTYLDTCGRSCNSRSGNANGKIHVISQAAMANAVSKDFGMGFIW